MSRARLFCVRATAAIQIQPYGVVFEEVLERMGCYLTKYALLMSAAERVHLIHHFYDIVKLTVSQPSLKIRHRVSRFVTASG